jgi:branched-chain amino acid transport system ATP-binding protein
MDVELVVENLEKRFGGVKAVDELSFAVRGSELVGLIGPNGSGKTTTIDTICGLLRPSGGRISFQGRRVDRLPPYRRAEMGLGRTFQVTRVFRRMSVLQNLMVPAMATGETERSRTERRAGKILEMLTLEHLAAENADNLSGGQRKLLELGRVLMLDPDLIFLDEPFAGVHPRLRGQIHSYIRRVHGEGKAFVIVSHDMDSIFELCRRVIVMNEGRKIADGDPEAVRSEKAVIDAYLGEASERGQLEHVGSGDDPDA